MPSAFRKSNLVALLVTGFVSYWEWAVIMASVYPYIQKIQKDDGRFYLALAQCTFPLGQGLSLPLVSILVKKLSHVKGVLLLMILLSMTGNVCYILADEKNMLFLIILGRAVAGIGAGSGGIAYGFIAANSWRDNRFKLIMGYRVVCMAGIILATLASASIFPRIEKINIGTLSLSRYTTPPACSFILLTLALLLVVFVFNDGHSLTTDNNEPDGSNIKELLRTKTVYLVFLLFLLTGYMTTWIAYVMPLVVFDSFHWSLAEFGWLLLGVSCTAVIGSFGAAYLCRTSLFTNDGEWKGTVFSCCFQLLGVVLCYFGSQNIFHPSRFSNEVIFITGAVLVFFAYSVCGLILPMLASKTTHKSAMPALMPYCVASMSAGKVVAPLLTRAELAIHGWVIVYITTATFVVMVLFLFPFLYRKLEPDQPTTLSNSYSVTRTEQEDKAPCNLRRVPTQDSPLVRTSSGETFMARFSSLSC